MNRAFRVVVRLTALAVIAGAAAVGKPAAYLQSSVARQVEHVDGTLAAAGEVLVKFRHLPSELDRQRFRAEMDLESDIPVGRTEFRRVKSRRHGTAKLLSYLRSHPHVEYAEPNYLVQSDALPNDPWFNELWGLLNLGQTVGTPGRAGADIDATLAWDISTGSRNTVVAVIDTGIDYDHPDLVANIWSAPAAFQVTIPGRATVTCPAGTHGFNIINNTCDPYDDNNHGTHAAGVIGAVGNNGLGATGVNWTASLMGSKFLNDQGAGTLADSINAIEFVIQAAAATGANVRVLSNSWRSGGFSQALLDEINKANSKGMLFVASAGNSGANSDVTPQYPASYNAPNVIAVAATDNNDGLGSFSNYGATTVHLGAPGVNILSTTTGGSYQYLSGTSMAAPYVSGAAALMLSRCDLTTAELKTGILNHVDPIPALAGRVVTGGRLNVHASLRDCAVPNFSISTTPAVQTATDGSVASFEVTVKPSGGFSDAVSFDVTGLPAGATAAFQPSTVTSSGTSILTVTPDAETAGGTFPLTITATSGSLVHTANVSFIINHAPTAADDTATTPEDAAVPINVLANDTDRDGDTLTITSVSAPLHGSATADASGIVTYVPEPNYHGTDTFTYTVTDGFGAVRVGRVDITVTPVNDTPLVLNDSYTTDEDVPLSIAGPGVLTNDSDVDGNPLAAVLLTGPSHGTLTLNPNGGFAYVPLANYSGPDGFSYKAFDGSVDSIPAVVSMTVNAVNDEPLAAAQSLAGAEDTPIPVTLTGSDVEGAALTYEIVTAPTFGSLSGTAPTLIYTPGPNHSGTDNFAYRVSDGAAYSAPVVISVVIAAVDDAPIAGNDSYSIDEDTTLTIETSALLANDIDIEGASLTLVIVTGPAHGTLAGDENGGFTYSPAANFEGPDSFTYRVTDGTIESNLATVSIVVNAVNDAPVAANDSYTTGEDTPLTIAAPGVLANDADPDALSLTAGSTTLAWDPSAEPVSGYILYYGTTSGTYANQVDVAKTTMWTQDGLLGGQQYYFAVSAYNSEAQQGTVSGEVSAIAPAADAVVQPPLSAVIVAGPSHGTVTLNADGSFTYVPAANYSGQDSFTYRANDGSIDSDVATATITVENLNDAPSAADQAVTTNEDTPVAITLGGSDAEAAALSYAIVTAPAHGTLSGTAPALTYTPATNFNGSDSFTFRVNDGTADSNVATVSITVAAIDDAPVAAGQAVTTDEDTPLPITLAGSDAEGATLTFTIVTAPVNGLLSGTAPALVYTPAANFSGSDSFTFRVNDGIADSSLATVSVTVNNINDAPGAVEQTVVTDEDTPVAITLAATDAEGSSLTYTIVSSPARGTLSGTAPALTYTPGADFSGADSFTFRVNDGSVDSNVAAVSITVNNINDAPVAAGQTVTTDEDTPVALAVAGSDAEGAPLTYTIVTQPAQGTLSGTAPALTYTPTTNFSGSDSFTFRVNDGTTDSNVATVSITVNTVNDAPVAAGQTIATGEDTPVAITLAGSDAEGGTLTYSIVTAPANGTLSGMAPALTYTPAANFNGSASFTFLVNDGTADSNLATVSINIAAVEDAPVAADQSVVTNEDTPVAITLAGSDAEGAALTYTIVAGPARGALSGTAPALTYTPAANFSGADSFTFQVNDGTSDSNVATVSISVAAVNDAPVAASQAVATDENTALSITLAGGDVDGGALTLTYTIVMPPAHGTLSGTAPALTYTPAANYDGPDSFTFRVNDGTADSNVATVSISIRDVNQAPVAVDQAVTTNEDTPVAITLAGSDAEGAALSYAVVTSPAHGTLSGTAPAIVYTPAANYSGADSFTFRVNDGAADSNAGTVSITVTNINDAPVAADQAVATSEDTPVAVTLAGTDAEGSSLTYAIVTAPSGGTLSGTAPALTFTPAANFNGSDSFTFRINDGTADSNVATVSITVAAVNDAPAAADQAVATNEDTPVAITLAGTDVEGSALTYAIVAGPTHGTLTGTAPALIYTPGPNFSGNDSFTFRVSDGTADSNLATVAITVSNTNDAPLVADQAVATDEDTPVAITLAGTDADGSTLIYTIVAGPAQGTLSGIAPALTYTPAANFNGSDSFTFRVSDGTADSNIGTVSVVVNSINDAPLAADQAVATDEDAPVAITLAGTDAEGSALTYAIVAGPTHGTLSGTAPALTYTPAANYSGADSFTFRANDGTADSNVATVSISVTNINDAPVAANQAVATDEDTPVAVTLGGTDADGSTLTYTIVAGPAHGTLSGTAPALTYTPAANFSGSDSFTFRVSDGTADSNIATVSIAINSINDAPLAADQAVATEEDTPVAITLGGSDAEGAALSYTVVSGPAHGTLSGAAPALVYTPAANFSGSDTFTFRANDGTVDSNLATVSISVTNINDAPVAANQAVATDEDAPVAVTLGGTDADGSTLTYTIVAGPAQGTLSGTVPALTYTPAANFSGSDSFTFRVSDGTADSNIATVSIAINSINDAPLAADQAVATEEDTPVAITLGGSDAEGAALSYTVVSGPAHGTLSGAAPALVYTPAANFSGSDTFTFRANDGTVDSNLATVSISVTNINDAPVAANQAVATDEDAPVAVTLGGTDADGSTLIYTIVAGPAQGTLSGTVPALTYTPAANFSGSDSFTFRVSDGTADSNIAIVSIAINSINDTPLAADQSVATDEDAPVAITLVGTDAEGSALTYAIVAGPTHGTLSGTFPALTYTPVANFSGADSFTFRVNDGTADSNVATVSISVTNINDAPVAAGQAVATDEDTPVAIALAGADLDATALALTYTIVAGPAQGTLSGTAPALTYTPAANFSGSDSFTFRVNDGTADSNVATVSITINGVNDAPLAADQSVATDEDTPVAITLGGSDAEGAALTYTIVSGPAHGTLSGTAPALIYTPAANFSGADSFTFRVNDGTANSNVATVSIAINGVNDAPSAADQAVATDEDTPVAIALAGTDADGSTLTYTIVAGPAHGTLSGTAPALTYTPALNFSGSDGFTFRVSDGTANSNLATVSITVTAVNDAPLAANQAVATNEDTAVAITLTAGDAEGAALSYTIVTPPAHGTLSGTAPALIYTPAANYNGADSFTFRVNDGTADSTLATVSISLAAVEDAPVAANQAVATDEDTPVAIPLVGSEADGAALTYTTVIGPAHGTLTGTAPALTYTPAANFSGSDSFTFRVNDGAADSNLATVSITINAINDAPLAANQAVATSEDTAVAITLAGSDVEGAALSHTIVTPPAHGTLSGIAPALTYTPAANFNGADSFTFRVNDGTADSNLATVSISVAAVEDAPVAANQAVATDEDTPVAITLVGSDADGATLTYTIVAGPVHGTLTGTAATLTYTPGANFNGADSFTFRVNDGTADSTLATVSISVAAVEDAPVAADQAFATDEDTAVAITLAGSDADGAALTYTIVAAPAHGTLTGTAPTLTYMPAANYSGTDSFTFRVSDGTADSNIATVSVTINGINDAPSAADQSLATDEDAALAITLAGTDLEGAALTYTVVAGPAHGTLSGTAPALTYTPAANYSGADSFTFRVSDGTADSNVATVSIAINGVNDAPVAADQSVATDEDAPVAVTLAGTDLEGAALTYTVVAGPAHGTLSGTAPALVYTPAANYSGADSFTFRVSDGAADSNVATVSIAINGVNDAPSAADQTLMTDEDAALGITLAGTDLEGAALTYTIVSGPAHGTLSGTAPALTYTPAASYDGADSFTFRVNDGTADSNVATVSITVNNVNNPPLAASQAVATDEDTPVAITLGATDPEGAALTYTLVAAPAHGTLSGTAPAFVYTPAASFSGSDSFTFRVNDGTEDSNVATVSITVNNVNDAPVAAAQAMTTLEDAPGAVTLAGTDPEGAPLTYAIVTGPAHGTLSGTAPALTYTPAADFNGTDTFTFRVNDGAADSATATVSITINPANDAPVASGESVATLEDASAAIALSASDADGTALTYVIVTAPAHGTLSGVAPALTYTPAPNYSGLDSFTFKVNDGTVDSSTATVSIVVSAVNDAPAFTSGSNQTVAEDSGPQSVATWATAMAAGPADENGQALSFTVTTDSAALFSVPPAIAADGTLTYTPAPDANGTAIVTVRLDDDGGTANGGINASVAGTFTITIAAVNDAPTFNRGADQTVAFESGLRTVPGWATGISAGPADEAGQGLNFLVTNSNAALFSTQPSLSPDGTLTFGPAAGASGVVTVTVRLQDNGGTANGGVDTTVARTFTITIQPKPSLAIGDASVAEGPAGTTKQMIFTVSLSGASATPVTVNYQTLNGTAGSKDYQSTSGSLTFAPGETSKSIIVTISGDGTRESNETLGVRLSGGTVPITRSDGIGTIVDDDA